MLKRWMPWILLTVLFPRYFMKSSSVENFHLNLKKKKIHNILLMLKIDIISINYIFLFIKMLCLTYKM